MIINKIILLRKDYIKYKTLAKDVCYIRIVLGILTKSPM